MTPTKPTKSPNDDVKKSAKKKSSSGDIEGKHSRARTKSKERNNKSHEKKPQQPHSHKKSNETHGKKKSADGKRKKSAEGKQEMAQPPQPRPAQTRQVTTTTTTKTSTVVITIASPAPAPVATVTSTQAPCTLFQVGDDPALLTFPASSYSAGAQDFAKLRTLMPTYRRLEAQEPGAQAATTSVNSAQKAYFGKYESGMLQLIVYNLDLDPVYSSVFLGLEVAWQVPLRGLNRAVAHWLVATFPHITCLGFHVTQLEPDQETELPDAIEILFEHYAPQLEQLSLNACPCIALEHSVATLKRLHPKRLLIYCHGSYQTRVKCWLSIKETKYRELSREYYPNLTTVLSRISGITPGCLDLQMTERPSIVLDFLEQLPSTAVSPISKLNVSMLSCFTGSDLARIRSFFTSQSGFNLAKCISNVAIYMCDPDGCDAQLLNASYPPGQDILNATVNGFHSLQGIVVHSGTTSLAYIFICLAPMRDRLQKLLICLHSADQMPDPNCASLPDGITGPFAKVSCFELNLLKGSHHILNVRMVNALLPAVMDANYACIQCVTCGFHESADAYPTMDARIKARQACIEQALVRPGGNLRLRSGSSAFNN